MKTQNIRKMRNIRHILHLGFGVFLRAIGAVSLFLNLFLPRKSQAGKINLRKPGHLVGYSAKGHIADVYSLAICANTCTDICTDSSANICARWTNPIQLDKNTLALLPYQNPEIKRLLWDFKYYLRPNATEFCAHIIFDELVADMTDRVSNMCMPQSNSSGFLSQHGPRIVIHCPSSTYFKGEKKFDHMRELLAKIEQWQNPDAPFFVAGLHAILPHIIYPGNSPAKAQHLGSRTERFAWAKNRFHLSPEFIQFFKNKKSCGIMSASNLSISTSSTPYYIYCIDDVTTTGASFKAITDHIQKELGVPVKCLAIAH